MSQINVNPGGSSNDGAGAAAARISMMVVAIVIATVIVLGVVAYGGFAGHWFGGSTPGNSGGTTYVTVQPQNQAPAASR